MKAFRARRQSLLFFSACALLVGCGGGSSPDTVTDPGGGPTPTPTPTRARITVKTNTSVSTIWGGEIRWAAGVTSATRAQLSLFCGSGPASDLANGSCSGDANIGDTITLAASDVVASINLGSYTRLDQPDDPRSINSQFVSFDAPCITRARGLCVLRLTGNMTVTANFKSLNLTRFYFSGLNPWELRIIAPAPLSRVDAELTKIDTVYTSYGLFTLGTSFPRCIGEAPGVRCISVATVDNAVLKMDVHPPQSARPTDSPGPLNFIGWSGTCTAGPSQFGLSSCTLTANADQIAIVKWEYYRCFPPNSPNSFANEGNSGWKIEAGSALLDRCTLTQ